MSLFRKIKLWVELHLFVRKYPDTLLIGGPSALSLLGFKRNASPPGFHSQCGQDSFLLTYFYKKIVESSFPKIFIDVGCNHPVKHNNSLFFERYMGFKVLAIDALSTHFESWAKYRPNTELIMTAVGNKIGMVNFEEVEKGDGEGDMFSSVSGASKKAKKLGRTMQMIPMTTLTEILTSRQIYSAGIVSIDIEGYEVEAIKGLDFNLINVEIIILENNSTHVLGCDLIRNYLIDRNFQYVARIWGMDDVFINQKFKKELS